MIKKFTLLHLSRVLLAALVVPVLAPGSPGATQYREIFASDEPDGAPGWSPDGKTVVFSSRMSGDWEVYTVDASGGEAVNFSQHPDTDIYANWSPTGEWIVYSSRRDNGHGEGDYDLWIQSPDGRELRCLTEHPGVDNFAAFDPTGTRLAFSSDRLGDVEIWVMPIDEPGQAYRVSDGLFDCFHSCWSPDGQWIAFDAHDSGDPNHPQLFRVPAEGGSAQEIPTGLLAGSDPGWSPDGRFLAFAGGNHPFEWDLWLWDFQAGDLIQLSNSRPSEQSPLWNAAGTEIVFANVQNEEKDVWVAYDLTLTPVKPASVSSLKGLFR